MKFYIFKDVMDNFYKSIPSYFPDCIMKIYFDCKKLDKSSYNKSNTSDFLFENFCYSAFMDYMLYYGKKQGSPFITIKEHEAFLNSSNDMYLLEEKRETEKWSKIHDEMFSVMGKASGDDMAAIEAVISYCRRENINPFLLLQFFCIYFQMLEEIHK